MKHCLMKNCLFAPALLALTMFFLAVSVTHAATFYVDAASGNDANPGTDPARAWATLKKVNAATFAPGDFILFKRGNNWHGQLAPRGSGTDTHVITLGAYSSGSLPVISGDGAVDDTLVFSNQNYWIIQDLEITNSAKVSAVRSGILIQGYNTICSGITLQRLYVHDIDGISAWGIDKWNNAAIRFTLWQNNRSQPTYFANVRVIGCAVRNVHEIGILMLSNSTDMSTDVVVSGNQINRTGADGIVLQKADRPRITGNRVFYCGQLADDFEYIAGIWTMGCESPVFTRNEVAYTAVQVVAGNTFYGDSQAFDIDNGCSGTPYIEYNYSHDNGGGFLLVMANSRVDKIQVRYNISIDDGRTNCGKNTTLHLGRGGVYVYNNVFYDGAGVGIALSDVSDTHYQNNIFCSRGPCDYGTLPQYSHNCYFGAPAASGDAAKVIADPQFVNPGSHAEGFAACEGYRLKPTTPCRHSGSVILSGGGSDFFGNALPSFGCDIGAQSIQPLRRVRAKPGEKARGDAVPDGGKGHRYKDL